MILTILQIDGATCDYCVTLPCRMWPGKGELAFSAEMWLANASFSLIN